MKRFTGQIQGFEYVIGRPGEGVCCICGSRSDSVLRTDLASLADYSGICERCSILVSYLWRSFNGDVPVGFTASDVKVGVVKVLIARRRTTMQLDSIPPKPIKMPLESNQSYEFLLVQDDLLSEPVTHQSELETAQSALESVGLRSWPAALEPLYDAYTPRGKLSRVYLARAWGPLDGTQRSEHLAWAPWPLSEHTGLLAGFYRAMETVWELRLNKHAKEQTAVDLSVEMRKAACTYVDLQLELASGRTTDNTLAPLLLAGMSEEEQLAARAIYRIEQKQLAGKQQLVIRPKPVAQELREDGDLEAAELTEETEDDISEDGDEEFDESSEESDGEFVRPR